LGNITQCQSAPDHGVGDDRVELGDNLAASMDQRRLLAQLEPGLGTAVGLNRVGWAPAQHPGDVVPFERVDAWQRA